MLHAALEADARAILAAQDYPVRLIVAVDRDSILYVNKFGKARTLWLDGGVDRPRKVQLQEGFVATEPEGWHAR